MSRESEHYELLSEYHEAATNAARRLADALKQHAAATANVIDARKKLARAQDLIKNYANYVEPKPEPEGRQLPPHQKTPYLLSLAGLTSQKDKSPTAGVQYAVVDENDKCQIFGDQSWVADGEAQRDYSGSRTQRRSVTIIYGDWEDYP